MLTCFATSGGDDDAQKKDDDDAQSVSQGTEEDDDEEYVIDVKRPRLLHDSGTPSLLVLPYRLAPRANHPSSMHVTALLWRRRRYAARATPDGV
jgi:hypothetical protein